MHIGNTIVPFVAADVSLIVRSFCANMPRKCFHLCDIYAGHVILYKFIRTKHFSIFRYSTLSFYLVFSSQLAFNGGVRLAECLYLDSTPAADRRMVYSCLVCAYSCTYLESVYKNFKYVCEKINAHARGEKYKPHC